MSDKCFACDRAFRKNSWGQFVTHPEALTLDGQRVRVGHDCHKRITETGPEGYQPPLGGPRLWSDLNAPDEALVAAGITITRYPPTAVGFLVESKARVYLEHVPAIDTYAYLAMHEKHATVFSKERAEEMARIHNGRAVPDSYYKRAPKDL